MAKTKNNKDIKKWMDNLEKEFGIKIDNKKEFSKINK